MDPINTQNQPVENMSTLSPAPKKHTTLTVFALIALLVVAAIIIFGMRRDKQEAALDAQLEQKQADIAASDMQTQALKQQGTANDPSSIEADINATALDTLDAQ